MSLIFCLNEQKILEKDELFGDEKLSFYVSFVN